MWGIPCLLSLLQVQLNSSQSVCLHLCPTGWGEWVNRSSKWQPFKCKISSLRYDMSCISEKQSYTVLLKNSLTHYLVMCGWWGNLKPHGCHLAGLKCHRKQAFACVCVRMPCGLICVHRTHESEYMYLLKWSPQLNPPFAWSPFGLNWQESGQGRQLLGVSGH